MRIARLSLLLCTALLAVAGCSPRPAAIGTYTVVATYPHDPTAYTQGLFLHEGRLFESTGLYGQSTIREVELSTGTILRKSSLPDDVFGEGSALVNGDIWMLTWREGKAYRISPADLRVVATNTMTGEGWGLTTDGSHLIQSDGTSTLRWRDPVTLSVTRSLPVTENGRPLINLNEMEYVDGELFANVYLQDRIVRINPENGRVLATYDLSPLRKTLPAPNQAEVLNGIAWHAEKKTLLVTGKNWPVLFELKLDR